MVPPAAATSAKRSRSNTRARLVEAASVVFADIGFQSATVEDVCAAAGFTRGAFYSNFDSKDELFLALWDEQADRIVATLAAVGDAVAAGTGSAADVLDAVAGEELYDRQWFLLNTEFLLHAMRSPEAAARLVAHRERLRAGIGGLVEAFLDAEGLVPPTGVDAEGLTRMIIAAHEGSQNQSRVEGEPAAALFRSFMGVLIASCRPVDG